MRVSRNAHARTGKRAVAALLGTALTLGGVSAIAPVSGALAVDSVSASAPTESRPSSALADAVHASLDGETGAEFDHAPTPVIQGIPRFGEWSVAVQGTWSPEPNGLDHQWLLDGKPIIGATAMRYSPLAADIGKQLSFEVTAYKKGYKTTVRVSSPKTIYAASWMKKSFSATPKPRVSGTAKPGKSLRASAGSWRPGAVKLRYQWLRNGKAIKGATKSKYRVSKKDRGNRISVRVTGSKPGYTTVSRTSAGKRVSR